MGVLHMDPCVRLRELLADRVGWEAHVLRRYRF